MARDGSVLVKFIADTLGFRRGTTDMGDALKEAERTTATATDHMSGAFRDAGTKIQGHTDNLKRTVPGKMGELGKESGNSLGQNFGATIGQGGTADIPGAIFGVLGDVASAIPGLGIGVAIAGALTLGIINKINGDSAAIRQAVKDAYSQAADEIVNGPKISTIAEVVEGLTPDDLAALQAASVSIYNYAGAVVAAQKGDPRPLERIRDTLDGTAQAAGRAAQNSTDYANRVLPKVAQQTQAALSVLETQREKLDAIAQAYRNLARDAQLAAQAEWRQQHPAAGGSPFPRGVDSP